MKFDQLRSIAHNIADSLADGNGFLIGHYDMHVFEEAGQSPEGFIEVDFLNGTSTGGRPSAFLARAFMRYAETLPAFCEKHGASSSAFRQLSVRFLADRRFIVTVVDCKGRQAADEYLGSPGRRIKVLDPLGRIRRKKGRVIHIR